MRYWRCPAEILLAISGTVLTAGFTAAWGGAWLMPPGSGQIIAYTAYSDSALAFNAQGQLVTVPPYRKFEVGTYFEYGLTDAVTIVAAPAYDHVSTPTPGQSSDGLGESEFAARFGIYHDGPAVFSIQAGLRTPGASLDSTGPFLTQRSGSLDLRAMAGSNYMLAGLDGFLEAQGGYRIYASHQPGEWRLDFTAGLHPLPGFLLMLQSFTSVSNGRGPFGHVSWTKVQPSLTYDIAPQWSLQIGGFCTVAGLNAGRELGPTAGVWYRF